MHFPISPHVRYPEVSPFLHQRELLASKVLEIGRSHLNDGARDRDKNTDARAEEAVRWLQKAFSLAEHLDDTLTAGAVELKVGSRFYRIVWLMVNPNGLSVAY
jgi:hypothetical protein